MTPIGNAICGRARAQIGAGVEAEVRRAVARRAERAHDAVDIRQRRLGADSLRNELRHTVNDARHARVLAGAGRRQRQHERAARADVARVEDRQREWRHRGVAATKVDRQVVVAVRELPELAPRVGGGRARVDRRVIANIDAVAAHAGPDHLFVDARVVAAVDPRRRSARRRCAPCCARRQTRSTRAAAPRVRTSASG
jgi:hypothetical protein